MSVYFGLIHTEVDFQAARVREVLRRALLGDEPTSPLEDIDWERLYAHLEEEDD